MPVRRKADRPTAPDNRKAARNKDRSAEGGLIPTVSARRGGQTHQQHTNTGNERSSPERTRSEASRAFSPNDLSQRQPRSVHSLSLSVHRTLQSSSGNMGAAARRPQTSAAPRVCSSPMLAPRRRQRASIRSEQAQKHNGSCLLGTSSDVGSSSDQGASEK